jgi:hypothetical protein
MPALPGIDLKRFRGQHNTVAGDMWPRDVKGKAIPLQAWTGPEGSRRLRLPDFKTVGT